VYDVRTGRLLLRQQVGAPGASFVNDVIVTRTAAYYTDSTAQVMYVLPFGPGGRLGTVRTVPLTGDIVYGAGFNANGIVASPDGRSLVLVQSNTGLLFRVSARTGVTTRVDADGFSITNGDGLLRRGNTLYVMRNQNNQSGAGDAQPRLHPRTGGPHDHRPQLRHPDDDRVLRTVHLRGERQADDSRDPGHHVRRGAGALTGRPGVLAWVRTPG
jgi:sugar lactone lactonase YvrE